MAPSHGYGDIYLPTSTFLIIGSVHAPSPFPLYANAQSLSCSCVTFTVSPSDTERMYMGLFPSSPVTTPSSIRVTLTHMCSLCSPSLNLPLTRNVPSLWWSRH